MTPTLTFTCSICGEPSVSICVYCTKDACPNHLCDRCGRCSDCCECDIRLEDHNGQAAIHPVEGMPDLPVDGRGAPETSDGGAEPRTALSGQPAAPPEPAEATSGLAEPPATCPEPVPPQVEAPSDPIKTPQSEATAPEAAPPPPESTESQP